MRRSIMAIVVEKYIRLARRLTVKKINKDLNNYKINKCEYQIPKIVKLPTQIECQYYDNMQVFMTKPINNQDKSILYLHGGAYIHNFSIYHWRFLKKLIKAKGYGLIVPNYYLLPKYSHSISHEKIISFYKEYASKNDMSKVILIGDSAGGGFSLALLEEIRDLGLPLPLKTILISPYVDICGGNVNLNKKDFKVDYYGAIIAGLAWANGDDPKLPQISPIYGNLNNLPPITIFVGTYEILYDDCIKLYEMLKKANNDVSIHIGNKMGHVFPLYPIPEANQAFKIIIDFIENNKE